MKGAPGKTRKKEPKKKSPEKDPSDAVLSPSTDDSSAVPGTGNCSDCGLVFSIEASTPKNEREKMRFAQEACLTSTPVYSTTYDVPSTISGSPPEGELQYTEFITQIKTTAVDSQSKPQRKRKRPVKQRQTKTQTQTDGKTDDPPVKCRRGRKPKRETGNLNKEKSSSRSRPRFELQKAEAESQDDSMMSSDLSIELSHHEEQLSTLSYQKDDISDEEDEEELPSFLMRTDEKPPSITEGAFVWHKYRNYPYWPALVKSVNRKHRKASIIFIDDSIIEKKKGFAVALKCLKPFDCEEANELMCKAKESYDAAISWSLDLITDYRFRIACGSFSGSFIQYFDHDMSYPVRRRYPKAASERLTIISDSTMEEPCDVKEDSFSEQQKEIRCSKRLLPDRTHAAHNRANEKLVHFIVKQHMVDAHLLAVIHGQEKSRWLRSFLSDNRRRVVNIYLEDDHQLDQVYCYLNELYTAAVANAPCVADVKSMDRVPFVLDVLLPEAIIYAIAGVDNISVKTAEEKYLRGRRISNRERQQFDLKIEQQMRKKSHPNTSIIL
ncbi:PWWP domain-containing DNA repair factor 3A [Maylandia zebra]|uniref:PWWP domain-containing protein MUM1 n=1 Tax=Maylandia zebra TaxID=106582 RepID=A0A3P9BVV7_9CICH|nr:PWWP domain-containing protein MUM1 [Maylandia zebra]XP_004539566.1 PWWP domain-containing protein MUM1 [Maylandia zebra]